MQPVTPSTTTGTSRLLLAAALGPFGARQLVEHLPRHGLGERLLDRDAGGLAAARLHARLGAGLQLLRALRRHRDEAELGIHVLGKNDLHHVVVVSSLVSKVLSIERACSATAGTRQRAARMMLSSAITQASRSSF